MFLRFCLRPLNTRVGTKKETELTDTQLQKRYPDGKWDSHAAYFAQNRVLLHNDDYLKFLVRDVWKLNQPCRVIDFGCGSGRFGLMLMPLLPEGSTYTGFDESLTLVDEAKAIYEDSPYNAEFKVGDVHKAPYADDLFDLAVSHAVLMHIPDPMGAIQEMIRVTRNGGMLITCDANRNAINALSHVDELDWQDTTHLALLQKMNLEIRLKTGVDHNIGIKTPILMHKAGLKNIGARVTDCVRMILPPVTSDYDEAIFKALCNEGYGPAEPTPEQRVQWKENLIKYGFTEDEADSQIDWELSQDFRNKGRDYHGVFPSLLSFSFGTVDKSANC